MNFRLIIDPSAPEEVVVTARKPTAFTERLEALLLEYAAENQVAAYADDEIFLLCYEQIECITVMDGKTYIIDTKGRQLRLKQRLYEIEQTLPDHFIRINKSAIANERHLVKFTAGYSGAVNALFKSGYQEYVSRRCFAAIKRRFEIK